MKVRVAFFLAFSLVSAAQRPSTSPAPENAPNPTLPKTESEKRILATISEAVKAKELYANVPASDGRMLRLLTEAINAKNVVEIGTSTGISGMWVCPAKAGVFSGRQPHQGKSQEPCSLDSWEEGN